MLMLALLAFAVRPELVEGRPAPASVERPSTSSGRTDEGPPRTAIEAERAFVADAQRLGQWAAFRKWAAPGVMIFVPEPTSARAWLTDRADPPVSVVRTPVQEWQSCDGGLAVITGQSRAADNSIGWFTTVWRRQADGGWRWVLDHGDTRREGSPDRRRLESHILDCRRKPPKPVQVPFHGYEAPGSGGQSVDATLRYEWTAEPRPGEWYHDLQVEIWDGRNWSRVLSEAGGTTR